MKTIRQTLLMFHNKPNNKAKPRQFANTKMSDWSSGVPAGLMQIILHSVVPNGNSFYL